MKKYKKCIMILADGARPDVLWDLAQKGELPSIADHLIADGSFRHANSTFPSTTGPAYLPYLTGCYPGTCNLPGIRWFDKDTFTDRPFSKDRMRSYVGAESFYMNSDLDPKIPTLFDLIPRSSNIFSSINRGVSSAGNMTKYSRAWYWYYAHLTDHWGLVDEAASKKTLQTLKQNPEFVFVVFPGIDEFSHLASPFHPRTIEAYRVLDRSVGKMVQALKKEGRWEETCIMIVSDHGLSETKEHFPVNQFLEFNDIRVLYYPKIYKLGFQAVNMVSGNAMTHLYFKGEKGWKGRLSWEQLSSRKDKIVEKLLEKSAVDIIAGMSESGDVVIKSRRGEARVSSPRSASLESTIRYKVISSDPFGYKNIPETLTDRQSLELTDKTDYPDAIMQLLQIFRSARTGDLVISASLGSDLRIRHEIHEHKSSHGGLHWEQMKVPFVTNAKLPEGPVRSVDIFPTALKLLDRTIPHSPHAYGIGVDGVSLL